MKPPRAPAAAATVAAAVTAIATAVAADPGRLLQPDSGGRLTVHGGGRDQLLVEPAGLSDAELAVRRRGEAFFNTPFVPAPSPAILRDGLGPLFNSASCEACHNNLGRGRALSSEGVPSSSLVIQLGMQDAEGRWGPHPVYGPNFNPLAVAGVPAEGRVQVEYEELSGRFADGTGWTLRKPRYVLVDLAYGSLGTGTALSPRMTQSLVGMGLLEAIAEQSILAHSDPGDRDGDGISGRPNWIREADGGRRLGRFGWKANQADVRAQTVAAFSAEQGITSPDRPATGCTPSQRACLAMPDGGSPEISETDLRALVSFLLTAPVPGRVGLESSEVRRGAALFESAGCVHCHLPELVTAKDAPLPLLAGQRIHPFTDLLLHDMGPGLADGRPDHEATGSEWRTPPLWGIGRAAEIGSEPSYLHDGRALTLQEAILWHGGEAERARQAFIAMDAADRAALIAFLDSL